MIKKLLMLFLYIVSTTCFAVPPNWSWLCSGFFITKDGYLVTANHCTTHKSMYVEFEGSDYLAKVIYTSSEHDFAILKISATIVNPLILSTKYNVGERVYTLGYPMPQELGYNLKDTSGVITDIDKNQMTVLGGSCEGNSGGPIINTKNQVVGELTAGGGKQVCSKIEYAQRIDYIESQALMLGLQLPIGLLVLDNSKNMIYNNDKDSIVIIFGTRD